jgi:YesN/AraC family two-component response regulator
MEEEERKRKVLIIDDEKEVRESLGRILDRRGYFTCIAQDGEEGLKRLHDFGPEIIICDIVMPKINGIQFLDELKRTGSLAQVIMVTGQMFMSNCEDVLKHDVCGYLLKPLQIDTILDCIHKAEEKLDRLSKSNQKKHK